MLDIVYIYYSNAIENLQPSFPKVNNIDNS